MADVMSVISSLVEVVLVVEDLERSLRFYRDTLGLELISPPGAPAAFLRIGAPRSGLPQQIVLVPRAAEVPAPSGRRLHHIGLGVAAQAYAPERDRLESLGYVVRGGEHPFLPVDAFYKSFYVQVSYTFHFSYTFALQVARGAYSYNVNTGLRDQL